MNARQVNAGFSLVEVVCAILILGVALAALVQGITTALASSKESELQTNAALIAAGQIETLRADAYLQDGETDGECQGGLARYRWKQSVTSTSIDGLHEIAVVVENSNSGQAIYELRTLLFEPPEESGWGGARRRNGPSSSNRREGRK
jgi:general secretion pathway protein I